MRVIGKTIRKKKITSNSKPKIGKKKNIVRKKREKETQQIKKDKIWLFSESLWRSLTVSYVAVSHKLGERKRANKAKQSNA